MSKYKIGVILLLLGLGVVLIAFVLSSNYNPRLGIIYNILHMHLVVIEGTYVPDFTPNSVFSSGHYEDRISIPYKYFFSLGIILTLVGMGKILFGNIFSSPTSS